MKNPMLFMDDRYPLTPEDFPERFHKVVFAAIEYLSKSGAQLINEVVVDDYLAQYPKQYQCFEDNNGMEYVRQALDITEEVNFPYYYDALRKCSLLNHLAAKGFDISPFYDPDAIHLDERQEVQQKMDSCTIEDIVDHYKLHLGTIENTFCSNNDVIACHIAKGMRELKEELKENPEMGYPLNSAKLTTIFHGRRLRKFYLKTLPSGMGKAIPNYTLVPTPDKGWRRVDSIQVGDCLFGGDGKPTKVVAVHPQPSKKEVYKITFADGRVAECCNEHLWPYLYRNGDNSWSRNTASLKEIIERAAEYEYGLRGSANREWQFAIPLTKPVEYKEKAHLVLPYVFGSLLSGDGFEEGVSYPLPPAVYEAWGKDPKEGLIPEDFLLGSTEQRAQLLLGVLDTHISTDSKRQILFYSISKKVSDGVAELCHSLGLAASVRAGTPEKNSDKTYYIVTISRDKEANYLAITSIEPTGRFEDMTCFTVDSEDSTFLMNDYIVTHNTRISMADACRVAVPEYYDLEQKKWVKTKCAVSTLFITTELEMKEIQTLLWAYVACVPEDHIIDSKYEGDEEQRVDKAIEIISRTNFRAVYISNFDIEDIETLIKQHKMEYGIECVFFDYIYSASKIFTEISSKARGFKLREDQILVMFSERLKALCNKLNIHIDSSTQANDDWKTQKNPDQSVIQGAKAIANKVDVGYIGLEPSEKDLVAARQIMGHLGKQFCKEPNLVYHIYKVRRGRINHVKLFVHFDYGTLRTIDLFVTDRDYRLLDVENTNIELVLDQTDTTVESQKVVPKSFQAAW